MNEQQKLNFSCLIGLLFWGFMLFPGDGFSQGDNNSTTVQFKDIYSVAASATDIINFDAPLANVPGDLYLAAISTKPFRKVIGISGLDLVWSPIREQCSGRGKTGLEVWMARGIPGTEAVTVVLSDSADNAVLMISHYSGVDIAQPVGELTFGNSTGVPFLCSGGVDNYNYSFDLRPARLGGMIYSAVTMRNRLHEPGDGFSEIAERVSGSSGSAASLALMQRSVDDTLVIEVSGSFSRKVDWAVVALEIQPAASQIMLATIASPVGTGEITRTPDKPDYAEGDQVELHPIPKPGYEFVRWSGNFTLTDSSQSPLILTLDQPHYVTAHFREIPPKLAVNVIGGGKVEFDPPAGDYAKGAIVSLRATPLPGWGFAGWLGDTSGHQNPLKIRMIEDRNFKALFVIVRPPTPAGIWTSAEELALLPTYGMAWDNLLTEANKEAGPPNVSDKDDSVDVRVMAKALVYARTGEDRYRQEVVTACMAAIDTEKGGRTLALGRHLISYVISADLVKLPIHQDEIFRDWLKRMLDADLDDLTLRQTSEERPNNWGMHAGASRAAVAAYLGDMSELARTALVLKGWLGDRDLYSGFKYGELDWQADAENPVGVNPAGATKDGHSIDGVIPDDQRRGGGFLWPPPKVNYAYEALQGVLAQAIILSRYGFDVWRWQDQAILRAFDWLYDEADFEADNDDTWQPHVINFFFNEGRPADIIATPGKNVGWTEWTLGGRFGVDVKKNGPGDIQVSSLGINEQGYQILELRALPKSDSYFTGWSEDFTSTVNPDTVILRKNSAITANFAEPQDGQFVLHHTISGKGKIEFEPAGKLFEYGTNVILRAMPADGWEFRRWTGDLSGTTSPDSLIMDDHKQVGAAFYEVGADTQTVFVFTSIEDAHVKSTMVETVFGDREYLRVRKGSSSFWTYLKFEIDGLEENLQSARLRLYVLDASDDGGDVFPVSNTFKDSQQDWDERTLTWNNAPALPEFPLASIGPISIDAWIEVDVTDAIHSNGIVSFGIKNDSPDNAWYSSKEGEHPPQLVLKRNIILAKRADEQQSSADLPDGFGLLQNYPNPFNPETRVRYYLPRQSKVFLAIYNAKGQLVRQLVRGIEPSGLREVVWQGQNEHGVQVGSGVYFMRLQVGSRSDVRRMILQK